MVEDPWHVELLHVEDEPLPHVQHVVVGAWEILHFQFVLKKRNGTRPGVQQYQAQGLVFCP